MKFLDSRTGLSVWGLYIGSFFLFCMGFILVFATITFVSGSRVGFYHFPMAALSALALVIWFAGKRDKTILGSNKSRLLWLLVLLGLMIFSVLISGFFYDMTHDGRLYHQNTIILLNNGWNPVYEATAPTSLNYPYGSLGRNIWTQIYPKGPEICAASIYKLTGKIQTGKAFNILLIVASFFLAYFALSQLGTLRKKAALMISLLLAFNPVSLCEVFSFYIDGQLSSLLVCAFALVLIIMLRMGKRNTGPLSRDDWFFLLLLSVVFLLLINTKLTGLAYAFFIVAGFLLYLLIKNGLKAAFKWGVVFLTAGLIGFFAVGYNPYMTNYQNHGHPLHPVYGKNRMQGVMLRNFLQTPLNLQGKNRFEKFFISMMSRSEFVFDPKSTRLKLPFSVSAEEVGQFRETAVRVGGFGPLFGGIFIVFTLLSLAFFIKDHKRAAPFAAFLLLLTLTVVVNPEFWYARLAPQVWLMPLVLVIYLLTREKVKIRVIGYALLLLLLADGAMILVGYLRHQVPVNMEINERLRHIADSGRPIRVQMGAFRVTRIMLDEAGIRYTEVENLEAGEKGVLIQGVTYQYQKK